MELKKKIFLQMCSHFNLEKEIPKWSLKISLQIYNMVSWKFEYDDNKDMRRKEKGSSLMKVLAWRAFSYVMISLEEAR